MNVPPAELELLGPKRELCMGCQKREPLDTPSYYGYPSRSSDPDAYYATESKYRWVCESCAHEEFQEWSASQGLG